MKPWRGLKNASNQAENAIDFTSCSTYIALTMVTYNCSWTDVLGNVIQHVVHDEETADVLITVVRKHAARHKVRLRDLKFQFKVGSRPDVGVYILPYNNDTEWLLTTLYHN